MIRDSQFPAIVRSATWRHMTDHPTGVVAIVDDDPAVLDSLKFLLEVVGYHVATHASAEAFLNDRASVHATEPACMILDQHMPRITGLELAQTLRDEGAKIPILLITGSSSPSIVARAAQLGIERVVEKPPDEHDLLAFVSAYI
jgi:two-component system response regulator FixJ